MAVNGVRAPSRDGEHVPEVIVMMSHSNSVNTTKTRGVYISVIVLVLPN